MKTNLLALALGLVAAIPVPAAFESVKIDPTVEPQLSAALRMDGLRDGKVVLALDVGADGRLTDCLVVAASHHDLIRACLDAVRQWRFQPARLDGEAVPARCEVTINITQTGAVISRTAVDILNDLVEQFAGRPFDYRMCPAGEVDRPLVVLHRVSPAYAVDAERQGIRGRVRVHFYVDEQGNVRLPAVDVETHPYLSAIAVQAMRGWKFAPPTRGGRPVLVAAEQEFEFGVGR